MVKNIWKSYIWTADKEVNESDPRSNVHYLGSSENKAWKKFRPVWDLNPWPLWYRWEVMGSNPVQAWIFFRPYFHYCLSSANYCEDHFHSVFVYVGKMLQRIWFFTSQLVWYNLGLKLFSGWTIAPKWLEANRDIRKIFISYILVWLIFSRYRCSARFTVRWYIAMWWSNLKR